MILKDRYVEERRQVVRLVGVFLPAVFLAACKEVNSEQPKLIIAAVRKDSGKIGDRLLGPHIYVTIQGENISTADGAWVVIKDVLSKDPAIPIAYQGPGSIFSNVSLYGVANSIDESTEVLEIKPLRLYTVKIFEGPPPDETGQLPRFGDVITQATFITPP